MDRPRILKWEMFGILFIFLLGSSLHFTFDLSGYWKPLALISGVNESVWEHLKIGFWPAFIWGAIEFFVFGKKKVQNFLFAKAVSFLLISATIVFLFYSYTLATGAEILVVDIIIFFIAIVVAQITSYRIMLMKKRYFTLRVLGIVIIVVNLFLFSLLSYFAPRNFLFEDPRTGGYGIIAEDEH